MNWRREVAKSTASDETTVHWREPSDYPVVKFEQDRDAPRRSLKHRMNRRVSRGSSDSRVKANREGLAEGSSALTERRCNASEQLCQRIFNGYMTWRAPDEPTPRKSIALVHPTLPFSVTISQRLFECLGLFIPPPLTHLRLLDCVEV
jgi:hypothetical protein